jgi:hypothetical protein
MVRVVKRLPPILDLNKYQNLLPSLVPTIADYLNKESKSLTDDFVD